MQKQINREQAKQRRQLKQVTNHLQTPPQVDYEVLTT